MIEVKWPSGHVWMKDAVTSHSRKHFRNLENQLKVRGELKLEIFRDGVVPLHVLSALVEQKADWAKRKSKFCMFDRQRETLSMLTELSQEAAAEGLLFIAWLQLNADVIATLYAMIQNNVMYFMFTSYDVAWYKYSPGRILLFKLFAWAMDNGIVKIDLMQGENEFKKGVAKLSPISLDDFTFPVSILGRVAEPILARTYFNSHPRVLRR